MLFISNLDQSIYFSGDGKKTTENYTLKFTRLDDVVEVAAVNISLFPDRYYEFFLAADDLIEIKQGSGIVEVFHIDETNAIRTDLYTFEIIES